MVAFPCFRFLEIGRIGNAKRTRCFFLKIGSFCSLLGFEKERIHDAVVCVLNSVVSLKGPCSFLDPLFFRGP